MAISETKMRMVIANYFKDECDVNTSIRQAFEKGFRIGVKKGANTNRPQEWISCSERLPDENEWVLCSCNNGFAILILKLKGKVWHKTESIEYLPKFVNAWMPLPEPWKGADDES